LLFFESDIALVVDTLGPDGARRVLWENAAEFYKVPRKEIGPTARSV
jgi:hypothetical protein